jgi:hypothetical protein
LLEFMDVSFIKAVLIGLLVMGAACVVVFARRHFRTSWFYLLSAVVLTSLLVLEKASLLPADSTGMAGKVLGLLLPAFLIFVLMDLSVLAGRKSLISRDPVFGTVSLLAALCLWGDVVYSNYERVAGSPSGGQEGYASFSQPPPGLIPVSGERTQKKETLAPAGEVGASCEGVKVPPPVR